MKLLGFVLLFFGWVIVFAALALLPAGASRNVFALAGFGVETLGLVFAFRSHAILPGESA
jgi:hypothetical protein